MLELVGLKEEEKAMERYVRIDIICFFFFLKRAFYNTAEV